MTKMTKMIKVISAGDRYARDPRVLDEIRNWMAERGISVNDCREILMTEGGEDRNQPCTLRFELFIRDRMGKIEIERLDGMPYPKTLVIERVVEKVPVWWP